MLDMVAVRATRKGTAMEDMGVVTATHMEVVTATHMEGVTATHMEEVLEDMEEEMKVVTLM